MGKKSCYWYGRKESTRKRKLQKPPEGKNRRAINLIDRSKYISYRMTPFLYLMFESLIH